MATETKTSKPAAAKTSRPKAAPKPSAVIDDIDYGGVDEAAFATSARTSKWTAVLSNLYDATAAGKVGRDAEGNLKFVKIGHYGNVNGARTQARTFEGNTLYNKTYEFKTVSDGKGGSDLFARVIETAD